MTDIEARYEAAARKVGFGQALDYIADEDTPTARLLRGILGATALGLLEMGYESGDVAA